VATLLQIILECVDGQLEQMNSNDGSMPSGHNGPYHDPETPVRNTGHWLISFSRAYEWTGDKKYINAARRCADYLFSKPARPFGFSFHHRNSPSKDHCNGLVGQAWTFEALAEATRFFNDQSYAHLAEEVFFQHPFNWKSGLWNRLEINGKILPYDTTFNHQLWFAACASMVKSKRSDEIMKRVVRFLDCLDDNLSILSNGLVYHPIEHLFEAEFARQFSFGMRTKKTVRNFAHALRNFHFPEKLLKEDETRSKTRENLIYKSVGYHAFNTYAFAILKQQIPDHQFWTTDIFHKMVNYLQKDTYLQGLDDNKYGYAYNPPGFEVPYSLYILADLNEDEVIKLTSRWVNEQFYRCFNPKTNMMDRNTEDAVTHTARIYELTRMPKHILESVEIDCQ